MVNHVSVTSEVLDLPVLHAWCQRFCCGRKC